MSVADQRILRGVAATLSWQPQNSDGEAAAPTGSVTVQVQRSDGTDLLAAGTATVGTGPSPRTVALPAADTLLLDLLTATWTTTDGAFTTLVEVVGGFYFSLAEARASDPALTNDTKFPTDTLVRVRREIEDEFERITGASFVPRYEREIIDTDKLFWPQVRSIRSVSYWDGLTYQPWTDITYLMPSQGGRVYGLGCGARYQVDYEHGYDRPPADLKAAALIRLRHRASASLTGIPDRATSFAVVDGGTYSLDRADVTKTGIPEVDAALARNDHRSRVR